MRLAVVGTGRTRTRFGSSRGVCAVTGRAQQPRGGDRAAFMYSLIVTAKMNDIDPQAWLADVLAQMPDMPLSRLPELLPWNWKVQHMAQAA